jgi:hypothetical protein
MADVVAVMICYGNASPDDEHLAARVVTVDHDIVRIFLFATASGPHKILSSKPTC